MILLSTAYYGNIRYYTKFFQDQPVVIEAHENYQKQSYRNRCRILTANGLADLTVPVVKDSGNKIPIKDVRIDYSKPWRHQHWYSIMSAYKNSAYYDYYYDIFEPLYSERFEFLWDLNEVIREKIFNLLKIKFEIKYSEDFYGDVENDFRNSISPQKKYNVVDKNFQLVEYYQVFSDKYDFFPDLSIIDLIFCEGPNAVDILKQSILIK
ncbi:MAG: WbqC family protein [Rikenellaceae bacterium]|nr:WbqC family protein [Rikenellaceae bacterium]